MRTRKDVELDINKAINSRKALQVEFEQLSYRKTEALAKAGEQLLSGARYDPAGGLSDLRDREEVLTAALAASDRQLSGYQRELDDFLLGERVGRAAEAKKDLDERVKRIRGMAGKMGLMGELSNLAKVLDANRAEIRLLGQDAQIATDQLLVLWADGSRALYQLFKIADTYLNASGSPNYTGPEIDWTGEVKDFGRLP